MISDSEHVNSLLSALGEHLDYMGGPPVELVICGGSALQILGLVTRTTKDVDVLALARTDSAGTIELIQVESLPEDVMMAAGIVAHDFDLDPGWLDTRPTQSGQSLPDGLCERLHSRRYGRRLVVHAIDRFDQICLKLHAVVDQDPDSRHLADLRALDPLEEELIKAAKWCLTQDAGETFASWLKSCLERIGYPNVAESIEEQIP